MQELGVPCPSCGSVEVVIANQPADRPGRDASAESPHGHVPFVLDCACRGCLHRFQHDFGFSR